MSRLSSPPLFANLTISAEEKERLFRETRGPTIVAIVYTWYGLSVIFVSTRLYVRLMISNNAGVDDWLIAASELVGTASIALVYHQIHYGDGRHLVILAPYKSEKIAKLNLFAVTFWTLSITGAKLSILYQYLRFFRERRTRTLVWAMTAFVGLAGVSTLGVLMTACIPLSAVWNSDMRTQAKCVNHRIFWQFQSACEAVTAWSMLVIVFPPLWRLRLPVGQRIGIIILLGLSSLSCVASVLRMKAAFDAIPSAANAVNDFTWTGIMTTLYGMLELFTGIICCSVPALMPLRSKIFTFFSRPRRHNKEPTCAQHPPVQPQSAPQMAQPILPTPSVTSGTAGLASSHALPKAPLVSLYLETS